MVSTGSHGAEVIGSVFKRLSAVERDTNTQHTENETGAGERATNTSTPVTIPGTYESLVRMLDDAADHRAEYTNIFMMESDTITPDFDSAPRVFGRDPVLILRSRYAVGTRLCNFGIKPNPVEAMYQP